MHSKMLMDLPLPPADACHKVSRGQSRAVLFDVATEVRLCQQPAPQELCGPVRVWSVQAFSVLLQMRQVGDTPPLPRFGRAVRRLQGTSSRPCMLVSFRADWLWAGVGLTRCWERCLL